MSSLELPQVNPRSQAGFGLGKSELYDEFRPSYPSEVLAYIRKALVGKDHLRINEIGSGSGIFTREILADPQWSQSITEIKCIEPNEGMRAVFSKTVKDSRVSLADGTFDKTGVPDNWADVIIIASAFHWCMNFDAAIKEFSRILKPDGVVCLLWNPDDRSKAAWVQQAYDVCMPKQGSTAFSVRDFSNWRQIFDLPVYQENFTPPEETTIAYTEKGTLKDVLARFMTWSGMAILSEEEKEDTKKEIQAIVERGDGLVWVDEKEGVFEVPFAAPIVVFRSSSK